MALALTKEFTALLQDRITEVEVDSPLKAMDTLHLKGKQLIISPSSDGPYMVELWEKGVKKRVMAVASANDESGSKCLGPEKFISEMRI